MQRKRLGSAALFAAGLLIAMAATEAGARSVPARGEGLDVQILRASADAGVVAGSELHYDVLAFVNDSGPATNLTINLPMPAGTGLLSVRAVAADSCSIPAPGANGTISCTWSTTFGSILSSRMLTARVSVPPGTPVGTSLTTTVHAAADESDPNPANNNQTLVTTVVAAHVSVPALGDVGLTLLILLLGLWGMMIGGRRPT